MPCDRDLNELCSALDFLRPDGTLVSTDVSPHGATSTRWPGPMVQVDASTRQETDGSRHRRAATPATSFSQRVSLLAPALARSWRTREAIPEGEIGRALLDMLGIWSTTGAQSYEVKVNYLTK